MAIVGSSLSMPYAVRTPQQTSVQLGGVGFAVVSAAGCLVGRSLYQPYAVRVVTGAAAAAGALSLQPRAAALISAALAASGAATGVATAARVVTGPGPLSATGEAMLSQIPPVLRGSYDYLAVIRACSREVELLEAAIETARAQFNPATADSLLRAWEYELRLPPGGPAGATLDSRRATVLGRLQKPLSGQGRDWERAITAMLGAGWSYQEVRDSDGNNTGVIQVTIPWPLDSVEYQQAVEQIEEITDAHLELEFLSSTSFELDVSQLDVGVLN